MDFKLQMLFDAFLGETTMKIPGLLFASTSSRILPRPRDWLATFSIKQFHWLFLHANTAYFDTEVIHPEDHNRAARSIPAAINKQDVVGVAEGTSQG